jgi:hypothetical protein
VVVLANAETASSKEMIQLIQSGSPTGSSRKFQTDSNVWLVRLVLDRGRSRKSRLVQLKLRGFRLFAIAGSLVRESVEGVEYLTKAAWKS